MSTKTEQKRQLIVEAAVDIFANKGYKAVTMKDIVEAAGISRGGLYLYFSSVEEIFLAVLENKDLQNEKDFSKEQFQKASNTEILFYFLKLQKKQILNYKKNLLLAKMEYSFWCKQEKKKSDFKKEMDAEQIFLQEILERGNASGEFHCYDPKAEAYNLTLVLEGMKLLACTTGISEKKIDDEFLYFMQGFITEE